MTQKEHQSAIALALANQNLNQLLVELAAKCVEIDALQARVAELEKAAASAVPTSQPA